MGTESNVRYVELRYTKQIFSEKDVCSAGDLVSLRNVEVYVLVRAVISRVDLYMLRLFRGGGGGGGRLAEGV